MSTATAAKFPLSRVRALYLALGVPTAEDWDAKTAQDRLATIGRLSDAASDIKDAALTALYDQIAKAVESGDEITVEDDSSSAAKPKAGKAGKSSKKGGKAQSKKDAKAQPKAAKKKDPNTKARPGESEYARRTRVWKAKWGETGQPISDRGAGVTKAIIRELLAAGKGTNPRGVTKQELLDILADEFPDRDVNKMRTTLSNQVPTRLGIKRHLFVWKVVRDGNTLAYYLRADNKKQPEGEIPRASRSGPRPAKADKKSKKQKAKA